MPLVHRIGDFRRCGATTVGVASARILVEGLPIATATMINSHGGAPLAPVYGKMNILIGPSKLPLITNADTAIGADAAKHPAALAGPLTGAPRTFAYGGGAGGGTVA